MDSQVPGPMNLIRCSLFIPWRFLMVPGTCSFSKGPVGYCGWSWGPHYVKHCCVGLWYYMHVASCPFSAFWRPCDLAELLSTVEPPFFFNPLSETGKFITGIVRNAANINKPSSVSHILCDVRSGRKDFHSELLMHFSEDRMLGKSPSTTLLHEFYCVMHIDFESNGSF